LKGNIFVGLPRLLSSLEYDRPFMPGLVFCHAFSSGCLGIITSIEKPQKVILKLNPRQGWYVITQPIHTSQKVIEKKDHFIVELEIIPTYELTMLIMGWGPNVEVIQPTALKKEILRLHKECVEKIKS
jgi:hypothetical protein